MVILLYIFDKLNGHSLRAYFGLEPCHRDVAIEFTDGPMGRYSTAMMLCEHRVTTYRACAKPSESKPIVLVHGDEPDFLLNATP
jgi:hypothetical protein